MCHQGINHNQMADISRKTQFGGEGTKPQGVKIGSMNILSLFSFAYRPASSHTVAAQA